MLPTLHPQIHEADRSQHDLCRGREEFLRVHPLDHWQDLEPPLLGGATRHGGMRHFAIQDAVGVIESGLMTMLLLDADAKGLPCFPADLRVHAPALSLVLGLCVAGFAYWGCPPGVLWTWPAE